MTSIGSYAFHSTGWYNNQSDGFLYLDNCLIGYKGTKPTDSLTINNGTRVIAGAAFRKCTGLTSVTIPSSVTSIGSEAFNGCTGLTSITIEATTPPTIFGNSYDWENQFPNNITIYVPATSIEAYRNSPVWLLYYKNIQPMP